MNRNKSLVIATGYRKKFVDIEEILKSIGGQSDGGNTALSGITEETNEAGGSIWYATVNDGNNDIQVPLFASRVKKVYSAYDDENASLILDPSIYNVVEMDSDGTVHFEYVDPLPDELETSDALSAFNEEYYEKFALIPIVGRITINGNNNITFPDNLEYAANNPDFETGHLYEFNIFDGIINIIDVTTT